MPLATHSDIIRAFPNLPDAAIARIEAMRATVTERFVELEEHERLARTALARLEAGTIRRFIDLEELGHG